MIRETLEIVHVINTLVHFLVGFKFLMVGNFEEDIFFKILTGCFFFFLAFISIHWSHYTLKNLVNDIKTAGFLTTALLFLTPVLKSLTVSYSDDTIILLVVSKFVSQVVHQCSFHPFALIYVRLCCSQKARGF